MALNKTIECAQSIPLDKRIPYDEFLKRYRDNERLEWVDGEIIEMSPVTLGHDTLSGFVYMMLREYVGVKRLGTVHQDPYNVKLGQNLPGRAPDVIFVAQSHESDLTETYLNGVPDLVVEVLSPKTQKIDRNDKFQEYQQAGVSEYWLLDPKRNKAEFYIRDNAGVFQRTYADNLGIYHSPTITGFWLKTEWFWQAKRMMALDLLREWGFITI